MREVLGVGSYAVLWGAAWQSSLLLAAGLLACAAWSRRPARAHRALLMAMIAAVAAPPLALGARRMGWGMIRTHTPAPMPASAPARVEVVSSGVATPIPAVAAGFSAVPPSRPATDVFDRGPAETRGRLDGTPRLALPAVDGRRLAVGVWGLCSVAIAARLAASVLAGRRLVARARPADDPALRAAANFAAERLGLTVEAGLFESDEVRCPVVWCWGPRPKVLVPSGLAAAAGAIDWAGVLGHELAHWKRRDHLAGLVGELTVCVWPWNPLAWWAKDRLGRASETACDDWVVAAGQPADSYAEALLGLVPQRAGSLALAAVTRRAGLVRRLEHILDRRPKTPTAGRAWSAAASVVVLVAVSALALAQAAPASKANVTPARPRPDTGDAPKHTVTGVVLAPDGSPARGARVVWIGSPKPSLAFTARPKGEEGDTWAERTLAQARTDDQGRFRLEAAFDPQSQYQSLVFVAAPGAGLFARQYKPEMSEVSLRLSTEVPIEGRLLAPSGMPAAGVRVTLRSFFDSTNPDEAHTNGLYVGRGRRDTEPPDFWPAPQTTGADGRFTIHGLPQGGTGSLDFEHPDYAVDEVQVSTTMQVSPVMKAFEIKPVPPKFTHTLEPARPVAGVVTDKATGKPLAGVHVEMIPMRRHGGMPFATRTDDQGRYRVSGHQADMFFTHAVPDPGLGYLPGKDVHQGWPAGAKVLEKNFALEKGKVLTGRVVDASTKAPIPGASVVYQPKRGNTFNKDYDLRNPVLCDADGRFRITGLAGPGLLVVETALPDAVRVPLEPSGRGERGGQRWFPHGFAAVDVPESGTPAPVEIAVKHGKTLRARALGPDGKPLPEVLAHCAELNARQINNWPQGQKFEGGMFELPGAEPGRNYRVYFLHPGKQLGAVADLTPKDDGSALDVRLEPMARVHGKLVNPDGSPPGSAGAYPLISFVEHPEGLRRDELYGSGPTEIYVNLMGQDAMRFTYGSRNTVDSRGAFVNDLLIPGARFVIVAHGGGGQREAIVPVAPLKPGEDRDLGTITIKERTP